MFFSKYSVIVSNLISLEYFIDNGCVHPPSINFTYRPACQNASLMTDAYRYIHCWSSSPIDKSITC